MEVKIGGIVLGERLRAAMKLAGLNQAQLSRMTGISEESMSGYMDGKHRPSNMRLAALAAAMGVTADSLTRYTPPASHRDDDDDAEVLIPMKQIDPKDAAWCLGIGVEKLRRNMQCGLYNPAIGTATPPRKPGGKWSYDIIPWQFRRLIGPPVFDRIFCGRTGGTER
jgi:transcriptional regulator with XRE-family HTH domain